MKNIQTHFLKINLMLLGFLLVLLSSCDKDDDPKPLYGPKYGAPVCEYGQLENE